MTELNRLIEIIATLRGPEGCPWDRAQDLTSMRPYLLEEVYETLEAMDTIQSDQTDDVLEEVICCLSFYFCVRLGSMNVGLHTIAYAEKLLK